MMLSDELWRSHFWTDHPFLDKAIPIAILAILLYMLWWSTTDRVKQTPTRRGKS
jgi:hypothetical protein